MGEDVRLLTGYYGLYRRLT